MHRITLQHRSRLLRTNPRRYFIASGVIFLIMYSKFTIPPLVEIRPVITQRVMFRFRAIRPKFPACIIYGDPFRVISGFILFPQLGGATLTTTTSPTPGVNSGYRRYILCRNYRNFFLLFPYFNCFNRLLIPRPSVVGCALSIPALCNRKNPVGQLSGRRVQSCNTYNIGRCNSQPGTITQYRCHPITGSIRRRDCAGYKAKITHRLHFGLSYTLLDLIGNVSFYSSL